MGRTSIEEAPFHFAGGLASGAHSLWDEENPSALPVAERLQRLASIPPDEWGEIYLMATIAKDKAIENGVHVAHTVATALRALLPLYTAAIQRG